MDWQNQREGTGENIADFVSTGIGYVIPGAGAASSGETGNGSEDWRRHVETWQNRAICQRRCGNRRPSCRCRNTGQSICESRTDSRRPFQTDWRRNGGGAAITPLAHGLMNAVQHLRKTKGTTSTSNVSDDVMRLERQQRELTNNAVEEQALQDTRIRTEPESLPIQAASESAPSLEQALESVAKQKRKLLQMENFLMTYKRCAMHLRLSNPLWRQMGVRLRIKVAR